jgi:hypothetical protein
MTHKSVELLIGKLASDEDLRARFHADPAATLRSLADAGLEFTPIEVEALRVLDRVALDELARRLDPRLQKASLHASQPDPGPRTDAS